eukprot:6191532-Pleurochrysis_carterae.AAC.1
MTPVQASAPPPSPHPCHASQACLVLCAAPHCDLPYSPSLCLHLVRRQRPFQALLPQALRWQCWLVPFNEQRLFRSVRRNL